MLSEIRNARQVQGEGPRRWFTDEYFDLIVWYDGGGFLIGFQLCYDKSVRERALTWTVDHGFQHNRIDSGEVPGQAKMSPIIIADGAFSADTVVRRFEKESANIDQPIARFVADAVKGFPAAPAAGRAPRLSAAGGTGAGSARAFRTSAP